MLANCSRWEQVRDVEKRMAKEQPSWLELLAANTAPRNILDIDKRPYSAALIAPFKPGELSMSNENAFLYPACELHMTEEHVIDYADRSCDIFR